MARKIRTVYGISGAVTYTGGFTAAAGTGVGTLRVIQIHFANTDSSAHLCGFSVSGGTYGSGMNIIPDFSIPALGFKTFNISVPLLASEVIQIKQGALCVCFVVAEETD